MKNPNSFWFFVIITTFIASYFSLGYYHPDEHWQLLEYAGYKLGIVSKASLPWEFGCQMRPTLQPWIAFATQKVLGIFMDYDPFLWTFVLRLLSAIFSLFSTYVFVKTFEKEFESDFLRKYFWLFSFFAWFNIFFHVRYSSEAWAENALLLGISYLLLSQNNIKFALWAGLMLGLSFEFRYQMGFAIAGIGLWLLFLFNSNKWLTIAYMALGFLIVIAICQGLDVLFYNEWTFPPYNYLYQNIILKNANSFGVSPWYDYFVQIIKSNNPYLLGIYLFGFVNFIVRYPKHILTWTSVLFILVHFAVSHKELRFLFPLAGFLPFTLMKSIDLAFQKINVAYHSNFQIVLKIFFIIQLLPLKSIDMPLSEYVKVLQTTWKYNEPTLLFNNRNQNFDCEIEKVKSLDNLKTNNTNIRDSIFTSPISQELVHFMYIRPNHHIICYENLYELKFDYSEYKNYIVWEKGFREKNKLIDYVRIKGYKLKRIYSIYPEWVHEYCNINNWMSRTSFLEVFLVEK